MTSTEADFLPGSDATYAVFVHLNAEKSPLYRAILRAFVAERARFALALRPSEIQAALATTSGPALPTDEVEAALRQLCDWGNLDDSPDTAEAASVEEFYRKRRLYQLSAAGEAAEQALTVFDEYLHRPGELQTTALHDILELLDALAPLVANEPPDDAKLHLTLSSLVERFEQLTSRAQSFMRGLQRTVDLHGISVEAFLAYKEKLVDYLERFIGELVVASNRAAEAVLALESIGVSRAFAAATRRELADALDPSPEAFAAAELRWQRRWAGLRRWFIGDGAPSQAELLRARARSAIPALLTAVTQINDRRSQRADRAADFSTLARWFARAPDDDSAHRLWRVAFALAPARHVRINAETLDARAQKNESPRTSWLEATPMWLSPRLRTTGRAATRGAALATIDRSAEKAHLTLLATQQAAQLQRASDQLLRGGRRRLAELGPLDSFEFRLFLELLAQALAASTTMDTRSHAYSADGSLRIVLEPMAGAEWVDVPTTDGIFRGRDHWITIESAVATAS
jgi:uncharacterized protein (TIGR02677 family)